MIIIISDTNAGYTTPQIPEFANSMSEYFQQDVMLLEPEIPNRPECKEFSSLCVGHIVRLNTKQSPYTYEDSRTEYLEKAAAIIDSICPDIVVVTCAFVVDVLNIIKHKPRLSILYSLELANAYSNKMKNELSLACTNKKIDIIIHPEENRAALDSKLTAKVPYIIMYNSLASIDNIGNISYDRTNNIIITALHNQTCLAHFYKNMTRHKIDICGKIEKEIVLPSNFKNLGIVPHQSLHELRKTYRWSIVMWNPTNQNQLYAAPNKLFESIAAGCPVICTPHAQCKYVTEKLGCGVVAASWNVRDINIAIDKAMSSTKYNNFVDACKEATINIFNKETQFKVLTTWLENNGYNR